MFLHPIFLIALHELIVQQNVETRKHYISIVNDYSDLIIQLSFIDTYPKLRFQGFTTSTSSISRSTATNRWQQI